MNFGNIVKIVAAVAAAIAASNADALAPAIPYAKEITAFLAMLGFLQVKRLQDK